MRFWRTCFTWLHAGILDNRRRAPRRPHRRLGLESLEDRTAPAIYTVTNVNDAGAGSLRQAILDANTNGGADTIQVSILGAPGPKQIGLASDLPLITEGVMIDATTQAGWAGNPIVELSGNNVATKGFAVDASGVTIRGWVINGIRGIGIELENSKNPAVGNNVIEGNYIGTDLTGNAPAQLANLAYGIFVSSSDNHIGGTLWRRNVIAGNTLDGVVITSGNAHRNTLENNFIGIGADGVTDVGNGRNGVWLGLDASNNVLLDNVISGNAQAGVFIQDSGNNTLKDNFIGTDANGTQDVGNTLSGVHILGASNNSVGVAGLGNVISGNDDKGVRIEGVNASNNLVQYNFIGTKANGTEALKNSSSGVYIVGGAFFNTVGGSVANVGNIISGNGGSGVYIFQATQNKVEGNYIGTDKNGMTDVPNSGVGVLIRDASQNTIGGLGLNDLGRNVISGNKAGGIKIEGSGSTQNKVQHNYVGLKKDGDGALGNEHFGIYITDGASSNTIGGTTDGERNVISGNGDTHDPTYEFGHGIILSGLSGGAASTKIQGNYIGTDKTGTNPRGNGKNGIYVGIDATNTTIGGAAAGAGNVISANKWWGVEVEGTGTTGDNNTLGKDVMGNALKNTRGNIKVGDGVQGVKISANNIGGGGGPSIAIASAIDVQIDDNLIEQSEGDAIKLDGASLVQITNNTITNNAGRAVYAVNSTDVTIGGVDLGNTFTANGGTAVDIEGGSSYTLAGNTITTNTGRGVFIHDTASAVTVGGLDEGEGNSISGNGDDALVFGSGTGHLFLSNYIEGDVEIWAGSSVAGEGEVTGAVYMSNAGTFTVLDLIVPPVFQLSGDFTQTAGAVTVVSGTTTLGGTGSVDILGGTFTIEQGTVIAPGGLTIGQGAVLYAGTAGSANLIADVVNAGSIYVGGDGSTGILSILADASLGIAGNYTQTATGTLYMELAGPGDYDQVSIAGTAALDGLLYVDLLNNYEPYAPDSFTLLSYDSYTGQFADIDVPALPVGSQFEAEYLSNAFVLSVIGDPGMGG
jgi:parallel beta-helix repeat protein